MTILAPTAFAEESADNDGKKPIYIINGKRAEPFDPETADMSAFKNIGSNAKKVAKLADQAGISEQELTENEVIFLKSKKPMYIAAAGQSVDYTGTVSYDGDAKQNIHILTLRGETDADGKFNCREKFDLYSYGYVHAKGYKWKRITFGADMRKKITLHPAGTKTKKSDKKQPRYSIVNGEFVFSFNINNYEPDEIVSVKQVWENTDEVRDILAAGGVKTKSIEKHGVEIVTLRDGVKLARPKQYADYTLCVHDSDGNPIRGAEIFIKNTLCDLQGNFTLTADCGTRAIASDMHNMFKIKEFQFGATPTVSIKLEHNPNYNGKDDAVFKTAVMPTFRGGGLPEFRDWLAQTIKYPKNSPSIRKSGNVLGYSGEWETSSNKTANKASGYRKYDFETQDNTPEGSVRVSFVVGTTGKVENIHVVESDDPKLAEEVVKALKFAPNWKPGKDKTGNPVRVKFTLPVHFRKN